MPADRLARVARAHARLAVAVLVLPSLTYLALWDFDPYFYGFSVLGFGFLQVAWLFAGLGFAVLRVPQPRRLVTIGVSGAAALSGLVAFAFLKSIHWA